MVVKRESLSVDQWAAERVVLTAVMWVCLMVVMSVGYWAERKE